VTTTLTPPAETIWLVWASRGDYSDRTEYAVCWFPTQVEAERAAARMTAASAEWRTRRADSDDPFDLDKPAQVDIGDEGWSGWDDTKYSAVALTRGKETR
jgi:hypothetical protein